jgi:CheY-like chemotaxis protein
MAHDFNNILQTIIDLSTMVPRESAEPETRRRMELLLETTSDARFLTSELLALGRKKLLDYRHVDLKSFLSPLIAQFGNQFGEKYSLKLDIPDEPMKIQGDPDYLKRVFQNLFGNARDAMPDGGSIVVSCAALKGDTEKAGTIIIRVSDSGPGISSELVEKIFDPFFTTKKQGKGTGLGLALVRRIVSLHNGNVSVEKSGKPGTTFRIELPRAIEGEAEGDTKSIMMNRIASTIIILDDDPKIRNIMKFFLKDSGYSILEASSGNEAAQRLKDNAESCRLLITDWKIDGETPGEVIETLRAIRPDLKVFVVSGYAPNTASIEKLGIYRWFTKPYDKNALDLEMQRALRGLPPRS